MGRYTLCTASLILTLCPASMCASPPGPIVVPVPLVSPVGLTSVLERHCVCWGLQQVLDWSQLLSLAFAPASPRTISAVHSGVSPRFSVQLSDMSMLSRISFVNYRGPACCNFKRRPPSHHISYCCILFKQNLNILQILLFIEFSINIVVYDLTFFYSLSKISSGRVAGSQGILILLTS